MLSRSISTNGVQISSKAKYARLGKEPHINLKISNLKPKIYGWLHVAWTQVQGMEEMIIKGWQEIGITNTFTSKFQVVTMEANALTLLFTFTLEVEENNDGTKDNDADLTHSIAVVIENCLQPNCNSLGVATKGDSTAKCLDKNNKLDLSKRNYAEITFLKKYFTLLGKSFY
jgi:hypothetical protein